MDTTRSTADDQEGFSDAEKAAMKERADEVRSMSSRKKKDPEAEVRARIAELPDGERAIAERIHEIVAEVAPQLGARTWYGMPAYALDGKVLCFLSPASKWGTRYSTFSFEDSAKLDDGDMWPVGFAVTRLTPAVEKEIARLVRTAVG